jgi:hypothetical protein
MWVMLDSTTILSDPRLEGGAFQVLFTAARRLRVSIAVPNVVVDEVCNHVHEQLRDIALRSDKLARELERYADVHAETVMPLSAVAEAGATYRQRLLKKLREANVRLLPYPRVGHKAVVAMDLARRNPFKRDGAGYRDMLIWQTLLQLAGRNDEPLTLITANTRDFGETRLHDDLLADLESRDIAPARVSLFRTVEDFTSAHVLPVMEQERELLQALRDDSHSSFSVRRWIATQLPLALTFSDYESLFRPREREHLPVRVTSVVQVREWHVSDVRIITTGLVAVVAAAEIVVDVDVGGTGPTDQERHDAVLFLEQLGIDKFPTTVGEPNFARLEFTLLVATSPNDYAVTNVVFNRLATRYAIAYTGGGVGR